MRQGYHGRWVRGKRGALAAGCASGALWAMAYPQPGWWFLAWLAWLPLLAWIRAAAPTWQAAACAGGLAGTLVFSKVFSFLAYTAEQMSGLPQWSGWLIVLVHGLAMAVHPALAAGVLAWVVRQGRCSGTAAVLGAAALVTVSEAVLPWLFPLYLGNAMYDSVVWMQAADVAGPSAVTFLAVTVSALLTEVLCVSRARWRWIAATAALLLAWWGYGVLRVDQIGRTAVTGYWTAVVVQHNPSIAEKRSRDPRVRIAMLDRLEGLTRRAAREGHLRDADAVVWAEGALPFYWVVDAVPAPPGSGGATRARPHILQAKQRVQTLQASLGVPLLSGAQRHTTAMWSDGGRNSAVLIEGGRERWRYDKRLLLAFGEYLPGARWLPWLRAAVPGVSDFEAGSASGRVAMGSATVLVNICYEALFASWLRAEAGDAAVMVNLTNDIWFGPPPASELHLMVQQARAVELRRPLLRATVSGVTAWVDPTGRIHDRTQSASEAVLRVTVPLQAATSPYRWWGDLPLWLLTAAVAIWLMRLWLDKRRDAWPNTPPSNVRN